MKRFVKLGLFLGSYSPLFVLLALLEWKNGLIGSIRIQNQELYLLPAAFLVLSLLGLLIIKVFLSVAKAMSPTAITVKLVDSKSQETLAYLVTYLIPFIGFKFEDSYAALANVIIFVMIGFLYVQSNMIHLNPVLSMMGYKVNKISIDGSEKLMLAKMSIKDQTKIKVIAISEGVYIDARK